MIVSRWNGFLLVPAAVLALWGGLLLSSPTKAQPRQDNDDTRKGARVISQPETPDRRTRKLAPMVVPAPREITVAAGRGSALVYALDAQHNRIPGEPVPVKSRRMRGAKVVDAAGARAKHLERPDKEVIADLSWAAVTGVVHHREIERVLANGGEIKRLWSGDVYRRVDLERQERSTAGAWSVWRAVDPAPTLRVLDNLPEVDLEKIPVEFHASNLVDPLPYLKKGVWKGVDVDRTIFPAVKRDNLLGAQAGHLAGLPRPDPASVRPILMVRKLDLTVQPGRTYRYRARVVVTDLASPGIRRKEVASAWSEATEPVNVP
jgi:hypothetical protein